MKNVISTPEFRNMLKNYTEYLIKQNPHHETFLRDIEEKFI